MRKILSILFVLFIGGFAFAQSADVITDIIATDEVTYGQICYLSAIHQGLIEEDSSYDEAVEVLYSNGQLPVEVGAHEVVYMVNLAFIYAQIWPNIKGGLMYKITNGAPRYAFKLFKNDGIFNSKADPRAVLTGREALDILTACMIEYGSADECMEMIVDEE